jgi:hypothetical protein
MKRKMIAVLGFLLGAGSANAATIEVVPLKDKFYKSVITVTGKFELGDEKAFREKTAGVPSPSIVAFNSPGGALAVGIDIGEQIRAKRLATFVLSPMTCSSACALAWIAGIPRYAQGRIGFHAAADGHGPKREVSSIGNAMAGAYLSKMGLPYLAIAYATKAPPKSMEWLSMSQGLKIGIIFWSNDPTTVAAPVDRLQLSVPTWGMGLSPTGKLRPDEPIKPAPLSKTVPGGEIKVETKSMGTVRLRGPDIEPPALTQEIVTNAISKRDKQKVSGPYVVHENDNDVMLEVKP